MGSILRLTRHATFFVLGVLVACSAYGEERDDDNGSPPPPPSSSNDAAATPPINEASPPIADAGVEEAAACATTLQTFVLVATADTSLYGCAGSNSAGPAPHGSLNVGPLALRFTLDPTILMLGTSDRIVKMELEISDNRTCDGTCGSVAPVAGTITAHVMRSDWTEGASLTGYSGADSCRRTQGDPGAGWGSATQASLSSIISSPADYGSAVGSGSIGENAAMVIIPLDPSATWSSWTVQSGGTQALMSFLVKKGTGHLVAGTSNSTLVAPPKLRITACK